MRAEQVNLPDQWMLARVDYRNVPTIHLKIAKVSDKDLEAIGRQKHGATPEIVK